MQAHALAASSALPHPAALAGGPALVSAAIAATAAARAHLRRVDLCIPDLEDDLRKLDPSLPADAERMPDDRALAALFADGSAADADALAASDAPWSEWADPSANNASSSMLPNVLRSVGALALVNFLGIGVDVGSVENRMFTVAPLIQGANGSFELALSCNTLPLSTN